MANTIFSLTDHEVFLITSGNKEKKGGFIATWVLPASLLPNTPRVLTLVSPLNFTWQIIQETGHFVIHLLDENQIDLAINFALKSGVDADKFEGILYEQGDHGPILGDTCGYAACHLQKAYDIGERQIVIGDVATHHVNATKSPLKKKYLFSSVSKEVAEQLKELHSSLGEASKELFRQSL